MPQIVFAAFLFPTDFTDNTDFRPDRSEVIVTLISQMTQIFDLFGLRFHRFCFWVKVIFCSSLQYRSALVATRMRNIIFILLLTGLPQERCPSGLWRKSYDRRLYVPKWNKRAMLYLLKPSSTSCLKIYIQMHPLHSNFTNLTTSFCHILELSCLICLHTFHPLCYLWGIAFNN